MKRLLPILLLAVLLCGCMGVKPEDRKPLLILRYADNQPEDYPTVRAAQYFADLVQERTRGKIRIRVYANGALGDEVSILEQVRFGGIDFTRASVASLSEISPGMEVLSLPYLFRNAEHMWQVLDGEIGTSFLLSARRAGVVGLSWFDAGTRSFYSRVPIHTLEDLNGLKIRVQESELMSRTVELLGAKPVKIPYNDVYSAIMTRQVDGAENNLPSYASSGHCEAAPYFLMDEHARLPEMQIMSNVAMDKIAEIDEDYLIIVRECARESALYERLLWEEQISVFQEEVLAKGCEITRLSEAERERFRTALRPLFDSLSEEEKAVAEKIMAQE